VSCGDPRVAVAALRPSRQRSALGRPPRRRSAHRAARRIWRCSARRWSRESRSPGPAGAGARRHGLTVGGPDRRGAARPPPAGTRYRCSRHVTCGRGGRCRSGALVSVARPGQELLGSTRVGQAGLPDGLRARLLISRRCDLPGCPASDPPVSLAPRGSPNCQAPREEPRTRSVGSGAAARPAAHRAFAKAHPSHRRSSRRLSLKGAGRASAAMLSGRRCGGPRRAQVGAGALWWRQSLSGLWVALMRRHSERRRRVRGVGSARCAG
jgi:hypothetical protein